MKEMERLRKNIRKARKEQKLSRNQLAKKSGISAYTIIDIELGRASNDIKLSTLIKISKGLNVPIQELLS